MSDKQTSRNFWNQQIVTLFLVSGAVGVFCSLLDTLRLAAYSGMGRLREVQSLALIWRDLAGPYTDVLDFLPVIVNVPFDLRTFDGFFRFLGPAMATGLAATWLWALLLAPLVVLGMRAYPGSADADRRARWFWGKTFPIGVAVAAYFNQCMASALNVTVVTVEIAVLTLAYAGVLFWLLMRVLPQPKQVSRFFSLLAKGSAAVFLAAAVVWVGLQAIGSPRERLVQPAASADTPNVLLISIDSLRSDHLHCYGYSRETSPTIDRLAAQGALFKNVVSPTSWTLPSHLTMLTSLPPMRHGVVTDGLRLDEDTLTLPEVMWQAGYSTAGFVSAPYLEANYGFSQGFDLYDDYTISKPNGRLSQRAETEPKLFELAKNWLNRWDAEGKERPFFLFLHMWSVHYDYTPPPPFDTLFDPDYDGWVNGENVEQDPRINKTMAPRDLEHLIARYDGEIRYTDEYLGRIFDLLTSLEVFDDTIVVVTADHGEEFFEHGRKTHRKALYDESVMVPLIIRFPPRVPSGAVIPQQVRLMDIPPTILSLAGLSPPEEFGLAGEGAPFAERDVSPMMWNDPFGTVVSAPAFLELHPGARDEHFGIRTNLYKLIQLDPDGSQEFFDLVADPGEQVNLLEDESEKAEILDAELEAWKSLWREEGGRPERIRMTPEHEERLRSLGYIK